MANHRHLVHTIGYIKEDEPPNLINPLSDGWGVLKAPLKEILIAPKCMSVLI